MKRGVLMLLAALSACERPNVIKNSGNATVLPYPAPGEEVSLPPASAPPGAADTGPVVPIPPSSPNPRTIPAAFRGEWNMDVAACGTGLHDSRLVIGPTSLRFYESTGAVRAVSALNTRDITVTSDFVGEGERWTTSDRFQLSADGRSLVMANDEGRLTRLRCPAEPKGAAAHSAAND